MSDAFAKIDIDSLAREFFSAWSDPHHDTRRTKLDCLVTESVTYADPHQPHVVAGRDAFFSCIDEFHRSLPGAYFEVRTPASHHGVAKLPFSLRALDGGVIARGAFFCKLNASGRIASLAAFADES